MSAFTKSKLKAAKEAISKKDFAKARDASNDVLSFEPDNYHANVFRGLASLELGQNEESEQAYRAAIAANPQHPLAWQGLSQMFERTSQRDKYADSLLSLADMFAKINDAVKCAEMLQKYIELRRKLGTRDEIIDALSLVMPTSRFYTILSTLPQPDHTAPIATSTLSIQTAVHDSLPVIEEITTLTEKKEEEYIRKEVEKRRTRLNAGGPEAVKKEVGLEVWRTSALLTLYNEIVNHPSTSDELRRDTEAKILRYKHNFRCALAHTGEDVRLKVKLGDEIRDIIGGVVLLGIPDELAWNMHLESQDHASLDELDFKLLRTFMRLFPSSPRSQLLRGYFEYTGMSVQEDSTCEEEDEKPSADEDIDPIEDMISAFAQLSDSILSHRILSEVYLSEEDFENSILVAEKGLSLIKRHEADTALRLPKVRRALSTTLGTSLVHLFPPKHHTRALGVLDDVLSQDPDCALALMGRAYIMQAARKWSAAQELFAKVVRIQTLDDVHMGLEAREEWAWCGTLDAEESRGDELREKLEDSLHVFEDVKIRLDRENGLESRKARVWWRLGQCYWRLGGSERENAYKHYIMALKHHPSFAPAFTALGIYYLEYTSPPDTTRASKCFQKAFELDPREVEAAQRLAQGFAEEREWDLVEVIARRTIEGEGGLTGMGGKSKEGVSETSAAAIARHKPTNAWAWKALGVVEMTKRDYPSAIQAFQVALRSKETDGVCWLRLGEAYTLAGRHAAALKALHRALELRPDDWMCLFQIGEVHRQTGLLSEAVRTFTEVLGKHPREIGVVLALAQTHLSQGRAERTSGYLGRAVSSFLETISTSLDLIEWSPGFRRIAWKTVVDALLELTTFSSFEDYDTVNAVLQRLNDQVATAHKDDKLQDILPARVEAGTILTNVDVMKITAAICSYRLSLFTSEDDGIASARFDFGLALHKCALQTPDVEVRAKKVTAAIEMVRLALVSEPGNPSYWAAFGTFNFLDHPKVAQHAYITALEINNKDVKLWTSLGYLYLHNNDVELANEAFYRAQTLDPDYTLAWVGQGLVASINGHEEDAGALFEHAVGLTADLPEADLEYAYRTFRKLTSIVRTSSGTPKEELLPPFFSLDRYCRRRASDPAALHLFGLVCERIGHYYLAVQCIQRAIKILEAVYEETEDTVIERRYAIANANLARVLLAVGKDSDAAETFDLAYGLLSADDDSAETAVLRAMCQFGGGIATFHLGDLQGAMSLFESALEIASGNALVRGQVTVLLSQTLWAIGTDDFREAAKSQLLDCIATDPENLPAVTGLAAMGLLTDDEALIDAALSEIVGLPVEDQLRRDPGRDVESLLSNHYLAEDNIDKAQSILLHSLHSQPSSLKARQNLASLSVSLDQSEAAQALLARLLESPPTAFREELHHSLRVLVIACAKGAQSSSESDLSIIASKLAQKAIALAPWDARNWRCLAYVRNIGEQAPQNQAP